MFVDASASGSNDGSSWSNAYTDLNTAISNNSAGDIWIATGTYVLAGSDSSATFFINGPLQLYGGFAGGETDVNQRDWNNNLTILSGDLNSDDVSTDFEMNRGDNVQHVIKVGSFINSQVLLDGLYFRGGYTSDSSFVDFQYRSGGGVLAFSGVDVSNCRFYENFGRTGGCVSVYNISGMEGVSVTNSIFNNNMGTSQSAGLFGSDLSGMVVKDCDFADNSAARGCIYALRSTDVMIEDCTFSDNNNPVGFASAFFSWNNANLDLIGCTFLGNSAENSGAVYIDGREQDFTGADNVVIDDCSFIGNECNGTGGAMWIYYTKFTMTNSQFSGNSFGSQGGAIYVSNADHPDVGVADVIVDGCNFTNNSCGTRGGAMRTWGTGMTMSNCTFSDNSGVGTESSSGVGGHLSMNTAEADRTIDVRDCLFFTGRPHGVAQ